MSTAPQIIPMPLAQRPTTQRQEPTVSALPTPGAHIRATVEGIVRVAQNGEMVLVSGTQIIALGQDVQVDVIEPGWQAGDVVHDGKTHYTRVVPQDGGAPFWFSADAIAVQDQVADPTQFRLIARLEPMVQPAAHTQQQPAPVAEEQQA